MKGLTRSASSVLCLIVKIVVKALCKIVMIPIRGNVKSVKAACKLGLIPRPMGLFTKFPSLQMYTIS